LTQNIASGILAGGLLALIAVGFSLIWSGLKIVNLAHFSLVLLAAYVTHDLAKRSEWDPFVMLLVTVPLFAALSVVVQWLFDRFDVSGFNSLLLSFGLFVVFEGIIRNVWGADFLRIPAHVNPYAVDSVRAGSIDLPLPRLIAFSVAVPVAVAASVYLRRSYLGKAFRAVAEDRAIAVAYGVNYRRLSALIAAFAGATAGVAGTFAAVSGTVFPNLAHGWIGTVFAIVILGGIGSPVGALAAAVIIGIIGAIGSTLWGTSGAQLVTFAILILMLLVRPEGLFRRAT
jgi:branched-chain amino acid transport system permease protein